VVIDQQIKGTLGITGL